MRGQSEQQLLVHFNRSLMGEESLLLRPFDADMGNWAWRYDSGHQRLNKTDSSGVMVCTGDLCVYCNLQSGAVRSDILYRVSTGDLLVRCNLESGTPVH